jgi:hypothetical protein
LNQRGKIRELFVLKSEKEKKRPVERKEEEQEEYVYYKLFVLR